MPLYEFQCEQCGDRQEILQKYKDPAPDACSVCKEKGSVHRSVSASAFHLKGGGWYSDLYASTPASSKNSSKGSTKGSTKE